MIDHEPADGERHEGETANARGIALGAASLVGLLVLSLLLVYGVMELLSARREPGPPSPLHPTPQETNEPALNADEPQELRQLRAAEDQQLSSYGWVDQRAGVARVPIERAIELFLQEQTGPTESSTRRESPP